MPSLNRAITTPDLLTSFIRAFVTIAFFFLHITALNLIDKKNNEGYWRLERTLVVVRLGVNPLSNRFCNSDNLLDLLHGDTHIPGSIDVALELRWDIKRD